MLEVMSAYLDSLYEESHRLSNHKERKFKNPLEKKLYSLFNRVLSQSSLAFKEIHNSGLVVSLLHNVTTDCICPAISKSVTFSKPLRREIDLLVDVKRPKNIKILLSVKNTTRPVGIQQLADFKDTIMRLRAVVKYPVMGAMISRNGFQSACEAIAKEADIALVPPITGAPSWFKRLTERAILRKAEYLLRFTLLHAITRYKRNSYERGEYYNQVYLITRESSGLPSTSEVRMANGSRLTMAQIFNKVVKKRLGSYALSFGDLEYVPLRRPLEVMSVDKDGRKVMSRISAVIRQKRRFPYYVKLKTMSGKELVCDPQRGLYTLKNGRQRLIRADKLRLSMRILSYDESRKKVIQDEVISIERVL
ncbi:hypothetical protein D4R54_01325 [archaeon]|nr:MAG: hypothetical protein D4R54_01325 [archaeon]